MTMQGLVTYVNNNLSQYWKDRLNQELQRIKYTNNLTLKMNKIQHQNLITPIYNFSMLLTIYIMIFIVIVIVNLTLQSIASVFYYLCCFSSSKLEFLCEKQA
jgi:hypothetical protein